MCRPKKGKQQRAYYLKSPCAFLCPFLVSSGVPTCSCSKTYRFAERARDDTEDVELRLGETHERLKFSGPRCAQLEGRISVSQTSLVGSGNIDRRGDKWRGCFWK